MTNRRKFLASTLAVAAAGWCGLARKRPARPDTLAFYPLDAVKPRPGDGGVLLGNMGGVAGEPIFVGRRDVEVGHFHGLTHDGNGRIACLYEATLPGSTPRRGLVKIDGTMGSAIA